ncbi:hypothetical protein LINPERHAP1_LOCUS21360 [Linum perenne]
MNLLIPYLLLYQLVILFMLLILVPFPFPVKLFFIVFYIFLNSFSIFSRLVD